MGADLAAIVAFIEARLAEDEADARKEQRYHIESANGVAVRKGDWARVICDPIIGPYGGQTRTRNIATGLYVARMSDPERVLRDVEAGRRVLERHRHCEPYGGGPCDHAGLAFDGLPCPDLRDLASRWSNHPEYQEGWKP